MAINQQLIDSLTRISDTLNKNYQSNSNKSVELLEDIAQEISRKTGKSMRELLGEATRKNKSDEKRYRAERRAEEERLIRRRIQNNKIVKMHTNLIGGVHFVDTSMHKLSSSLANSNTPLTNIANSIAEAIPLFGITAVMATGIAALEKTTQGFATLTKSGITVSDGVLGTIEATARLGLSFGDGIKILQENRTVINQAGLPAITNFVNNLRNSSSELYSFGFTVSDIAERSIQYLQIQRNLDKSNTTDLTRREQGFKDQLTSFFRVSQIVGKDLGELMDEFQKSSEDPLKRLFLETIPEGQQAAFAAISTSIPEIATALTQMDLYGGNIALVDNYSKLQSIGALDMVQRIYDRSKAGVGDDLTGSEDILSIIREYGQFMEQQAIFQGQISQLENQQLAAQIRAMAFDMNEAPKQRMAEVDAQTKAVLEAQAALQNIAKDAQVLLVEQFKDVDFDAAAKNIQLLGNSIKELLTGTAGLGNIDRNETIFGALDGSELTSLPDKIDKASSGISSTIIENALVVGIGGIFTMAMTSSAARAGMGNAIGKFYDGMYDLINKTDFKLPKLPFLDGNNLDADIGDGDNRRSSSRLSMRTILKRLGLIGAAVSAVELGTIVTDDSLTTDEKIEQGSAVVGGIGGAATGAATGASLGATVGSIVPGVGTVIGGAAGGVIGGALGYFGGDYLGSVVGKQITSGISNTSPVTSPNLSGMTDPINKQPAQDNITAIAELARTTSSPNLSGMTGTINKQPILDNTSEIAEPVSNNTFTGSNEAYNELLTAQQQLQENQQAEQAALEEIPDAPSGMNRYERRRFQQERAKLRQEIIQNYEDRNTALRVTIGALNEYLRETDTLGKSYPGMMTAP